MTKLISSNCNASSVQLNIADGLLHFKIAGTNSEKAYTALDVVSVKFVGVKKKKSIWRMIFNHMLSKSIAAGSNLYMDDQRNSYVIGIKFSDGVEIAIRSDSPAVLEALSLLRDQK
ncbi:hypothetical protein [Phaeovulum vinaykumarii]|uniref:Uncharacterized protein n=1 Tax=Phaeovulum vinaykumarii TaxID=407234 RepID=A0A1N7JW01_9RHOB|nr:hypothetical protein [Phaeovulum vinaykumarii]SIS53416.1 hypothetical protein SAMN05421795_101377 [Phaeovulum vinaykumarii]SOB91582.1 hypothetical protein SAMN05878426_101375 [Phaeovulum vinaykumarii]